MGRGPAQLRGQQQLTFVEKIELEQLSHSFQNTFEFNRTSKVELRFSIVLPSDSILFIIAINNFHHHQLYVGIK